VPFELSEIGTRLLVELPDEYPERAGEPVEAEVCAVPFRPSVNLSAREKATAHGRDYAD
jgi:aminomethyltransferase